MASHTKEAARKRGNCRESDKTQSKTHGTPIRVKRGRRLGCLGVGFRVLEEQLAGKDSED